MVSRNEKSVYIRVYGNVQGVFFRKSAHNKARELNLAGFVRNEQDGSVYIEAQGAPSAIEEFIAWCKKGPLAANVESITVEQMEPRKLKGFTIKQ